MCNTRFANDLQRYLKRCNPAMRIFWVMCTKDSVSRYVGRALGRYSTDRRSLHRPRVGPVSADMSALPTLDRYLVDTRPTRGRCSDRLSVECRPAYRPTASLILSRSNIENHSVVKGTVNDFSAKVLRPTSYRCDRLCKSSRVTSPLNIANPKERLF